MNRPERDYRMGLVPAAFALLCLGISVSVADQLTVSYVDENSQAQNLVVDSTSSQADLALAADLLNEYGVALALDTTAGTGTIVDLAVAMAGVLVGSKETLITW